MNLVVFHLHAPGVLGDQGLVHDQVLELVLAVVLEEEQVLEEEEQVHV